MQVGVHKPRNPPPNVSTIRLAPAEQHLPIAHLLQRLSIHSPDQPISPTPPPNGQVDRVDPIAQPTSPAGALCEEISLHDRNLLSSRPEVVFCTSWKMPEGGDRYWCVPETKKTTTLG
ncbi:unnamed protein product [Protopolystoma xenopodis]|uniref:Uncharacterized protein n=1 Tax=Protopolystoma xenopodis TaxID=117903 RepID=A0A3S5CKH3_9PLAT|nr:unnamed protein product [Protopolystoma xenopodis]